MRTVQINDLNDIMNARRKCNEMMNIAAPQYLRDIHAILDATVSAVAGKNGTHVNIVYRIPGIPWDITVPAKYCDVNDRIVHE